MFYSTVLINLPHLIWWCLRDLSLSFLCMVGSRTLFCWCFYFTPLCGSIFISFWEGAFVDQKLQLFFCSVRFYPEPGIHVFTLDPENDHFMLTTSSHAASLFAWLPRYWLFSRFQPHQCFEWFVCFFFSEFCPPRSLVTTPPFATTVVHHFSERIFFRPSFSTNRPVVFIPLTDAVILVCPHFGPLCIEWWIGVAFWRNLHTSFDVEIFLIPYLTITKLNQLESASIPGGK